jgi:signal transduction histidine kinase
LSRIHGTEIRAPGVGRGPAGLKGSLMLRLSVTLPNRPLKTVNWDRDVLTMGRSPGNDIQVAADNVSGQHARIVLEEGECILRDMHSTNGTIVERGPERYLLRGDALEMTLSPGDRIGLASMDNLIVMDAIELPEAADDTEGFEQTVLAEAQHGSDTDFEAQLGQDFEALQSTVRLARELVGQESLHDIGALTVGTCLRAFPKARRALFIVPRGDQWSVECMQARTALASEGLPQLLRSPLVLNRCLNERKGFLFLFESNQMQAVATMIGRVEEMNESTGGQDRIILCCPLFHQERCYGFIEIEAPLTPIDRNGLTRRDLSLATLMGHLVSARLYDLESQRMRIKLARKATAGFVSAMVGHCFKNLLFVPMSISKMLPMCLKQGKMDEVEWMLARNLVNIRYLDILSNEFAAASKDPTEGFESCALGQMLKETAELVNQVAPDKVEARLFLQPDLPEVVCHGAALKRLVMNLVLNAVDALFGMKRDEKGIIELRGAIDPATQRMCIAVSDNGPGIPEAILENLREIYTQIQSSADAMTELQSIAERVRSTKDQGFKEHYGLGFLFVCQTIYHHQGTLEIESAPGEGSRFFISFPVKRAAPVTSAVE